MAGTTAFGTEPTRLRSRRILLVVAGLGLAGLAALTWMSQQGEKAPVAKAESSTTPGWTAAQMHYEKPEVKAEVPPPKPRDLTAEELAKLRAMMEERMGKMQAELNELKNRKVPAPVVTQQAQPKEPVKKTPAPLLFVQHDIKDVPAKPLKPEYVLAPGATKLPCVLETAVNSDVEGYLTAKVTSNIYDTATGRHLLIPQGSTILGNDQSQQLLFGNERLPTVSLTLALPDGRSADLGKAPITDQQGVAGLTGDVNNHWGRLLGAVFIGGALRGGTQALQVALSDAAGAGQVAAGFTGVLNQASNPRIGRALDTRPTITIEAGSLCNVLLIKPLTLPAMWQ